VSVLSDAQIAAMSPAERHQLIQRLERPLDELIPATRAHRTHWSWLGLMIGGTIALIPWIVYLALVLPANYLVRDWPATWMGFDLLLLALMAATIVLGIIRRQLVLLTASATAVLLVCDAWFDIMTAGPNDFRVSVLTAVLADLPMAVLLIAGTLRLVRLTATRLWLLEPSTPLWRLPLLP
jgi:hypothetical protein